MFEKNDLKKAEELQDEYSKVTDAINVQLADLARKEQARAAAQQRLDDSLAESVLAGAPDELLDSRRALATKQHEVDTAKERLRALRSRLLAVVDSIVPVIQALADQLPKIETDLRDGLRARWLAASQELARIEAEAHVLGCGPINDQPIPQQPAPTLEELSPAIHFWKMLRRDVRHQADGRLDPLLSAGSEPPVGSLERIRKAQDAVHAAEERDRRRRAEEKAGPILRAWAARDQEAREQ